MVTLSEIRESVFSKESQRLPAEQVVAVAAKVLSFLGVELDASIGPERLVEVTIGDLRSLVEKAANNVTE